MSLHPFARIPVEAGWHMCEYLDRGSLNSLALTSRLSHAVASAVICRTIVITITTRQMLISQLQSISTMLERSLSFGHVRTLRLESPGTDNFLCEDKFFDQKLKLPSPSYSQDYDEDDAVSSDLDWTELVRLLPRLTALQHLIYAHENPLPRPVLEALEMHCPACCLHLHSFELPVREILSEQRSYVRKLLASRSLFCVAARWEEPDGEDDQKDVVNALQKAARGWSPSLRRLRLFQASSGAGLAMLSGLHGAPQDNVVRDSNCVPDHGLPKLSIKHLELVGNSSLAPAALRGWSRAINFTDLKALHLEGRVQPEALQVLAAEPGLQSIHTLSLQVCDPGPRDGRSPTWLCAFFENLPGLTALKLSGDLYPDVLSAIPFHVTAELRALTILPSRHVRHERLVFDHSTLMALADNCQEIRRLHIPVRRSIEPHKERDLYHALSHNRNLRDLILLLDCSGPNVMGPPPYVAEPEDSSFLGFDLESFDWPGAVRKPLNGHVRQALQKSAIDVHLARAIFKEIATPPSQLKTLRVYGEGAGEFGQRGRLHSLNEVAAVLVQPWEVVKDSSVAEGCVAVPLQPVHDVGPIEMHGAIVPVFEAIWGNDSSKDWKKSWSSVLPQ